MAAKPPAWSGWRTSAAISLTAVGQSCSVCPQSTRRVRDRACGGRGRTPPMTWRQAGSSARNMSARAAAKRPAWSGLRRSHTRGRTSVGPPRASTLGRPSEAMLPMKLAAAYLRRAGSQSSRGGAVRAFRGCNWGAGVSLLRASTLGRPSGAVLPMQLAAARLRRRQVSGSRDWTLKLRGGTARGEQG